MRPAVGAIQRRAIESTHFVFVACLQSSEPAMVTHGLEFTVPGFVEPLEAQRLTVTAPVSYA